MQIKYQNEPKREPETFTGNAQEWPDGLYWNGEYHHIFVDDGEVNILHCGRPSAFAKNHSWNVSFTRLCDTAKIASITMAGSPLVVETSPKLSDPCDLNVGDWVRCDWSHERRKVVSVEGRKNFTTDDGRWWIMSGKGYTVIPAPDQGEQR